MSERKGVLFVCLGNTCRSPIAEAVFAHLVKQRNLTSQWFCDSAAIADYHVGRQPNYRTLNVLKRHSVECNHRARQLCDEDFTRFDYIFGMDLENIKDINDLKPINSKAIIELLGKYDPQNDTIIRDPYYDRGDKGFETNYQQCLRSCNAFLDQFRLQFN
jgi:low molecular weight phosphotyrosine protein phosphatase